MAGDATAEAMRWAQDPHNADTTNYLDADGTLLGWVYPIRPFNPAPKGWRAVFCRRAMRWDLPPHADHPTELAARAWVEGEVAKMREAGRDA